MNNRIPCKRGKKWKNWANTLSAKPQCIFYPKSQDDLIALVKQAKANKKKIRMAGSSHSWSPLVPTDSYLVMMGGLNSVTPYRNEKGSFVTIGPGATIGKVTKKTTQADMAFPTNGVPFTLQMGGFVAAGCHGTGWEQPTVPDLVYAMDIVLASGEVRTFSVEIDGEDVMNKVRVNLGSIGIISSITFKIEEMFNVHNVDETVPLNQVINKDDPSILKNWVASPDNQYLEMMWMPFNGDTPAEDKIFIKHYKRTDKPLSRVKWGNYFFELTEPVLGPLFSLIQTIFIQLRPSAIPKMSKNVSQLIPQNNSVVPVTEALHYHKRAFRTLKISLSKPPYENFIVGDASWAIPIDEDFGNITTALCQIVDTVYDWAKDGKYPVSVVMIRFLKNSQALLSPAYQPAGSNVHTCFIEFITYAPKAHFEGFLNLIAHKLWMKMNGRPHWAKQFQNIDGIFPYLQQVYGPEFGDTLKKFKAFRDELDPDGMFLNAFVERIFSGR